MSATYSTLRRLLDGARPRLLQVFGSISPRQQETLAQMASVRHVAKGDIIAREGAECDEVGWLLDGALAMVEASNGGPPQIIGVLLPTDMYGRLFDGPFRYRIEALGDARLLCLPKAAFESFLRGEPEIERRFIVTILDELDSAREWAMLLNNTSVVERVGSFLLILARRTHAGGIDTDTAGVRVHVPFRRKDLAACLAIRSESLSRAIHRLASEGTIRIVDPDTFDILDMQALFDISGQDARLPEIARGKG